MRQEDVSNVSLWFSFRVNRSSLTTWHFLKSIIILWILKLELYLPFNLFAVWDCNDFSYMQSNKLFIVFSDFVILWWHSTNVFILVDSVSNSPGDDVVGGSGIRLLYPFTRDEQVLCWNEYPVQIMYFYIKCVNTYSRKISTGQLMEVYAFKVNSSLPLVIKNTVNISWLC